MSKLVLLFSVFLVLLGLACPHARAKAENQPDPKMTSALGLQEFHFAPTTGPAIVSEYPFLKDEIKSIENDDATAKVPQASQFEIATISKTLTGLGGDLLFFRVSGSLTCGTSGCASTLYEVAPATGAHKLLDVQTQANGPLYIRRCGNRQSLVMFGGHGVHMGWSEWLFTGNSFEHATNYPDLARLPVCEEGAFQPNVYNHHNEPRRLQLECGETQITLTCGHGIPLRAADQRLCNNNSLTFSRRNGSSITPLKPALLDPGSAPMRMGCSKGTDGNFYALVVYYSGSSACGRFHADAIYDSKGALLPNNIPVARFIVQKGLRFTKIETIEENLSCDERDLEPGGDDDGHP